MLKLSVAALRQIFPQALPGVIEAFASDDGQVWLAKAGITANAKRLATAFAHCHAETAGFSITNLTENINYTAERMAAVWPNRFANAAAVRGKYGTAPGWQKKAFDDIYGNRMGNRPGTSDGSMFIGRGGPQVTGREGYHEVGERAGLSLEAFPDLACRPEHQPRILAAFWMWKNLSPLADAGGVDATVTPWNGGTNGLAERRAQYARILLIVQKLPLGDVAPVPASAPQATPPSPPQSLPPATPAPAEPQPAPSLLAAIIAAIAQLFWRK